MPVWYHGELVGWTRYEQLARHVDVNCTGNTEDPQALLLRTNTTTTITTTKTLFIKTHVYRHNGTQNVLQCYQRAMPYIKLYYFSIKHIANSRTVKTRLTRGREPSLAKNYENSNDSYVSSCCVFHLGPTLLLSFLHFMLSSLSCFLIYI